MKPWDLARYLIDAKKCVDSILFINNNIEKLKHLDIRELVNLYCDRFYIRCCVVLDKTVAKTGKNKRYLCNINEVINQIYIERDKNSAHKDEDYCSKNTKIFKIIEMLQQQINEVKLVCKDHLPDALSFDFVPHDKVLFRLIYKINTPEKEEQIKKIIHPLYSKEFISEKDKNIKQYKILYDTEDIRQIKEDERSDYAVILDAGLNSYEELQNIQDAFIKINVLHNQNMWYGLEQN